MIVGVDYASVDANNKPDFAAAKKFGVQFVILRGTYGTWLDPVVHRDWQAIKDAGLVRGAYMFPVYSGNPVTEATAFINAVGPLGPGDLPPTLDIEFPGHGLVDTRKTPAQALAWLEAAAQVLLDHYGTLLNYTSGRVWHEDLRDIASKLFASTHNWLARYTYGEHQAPHLGESLLPGVVPPQLGDKDDYWIHQCQGDAWYVPGFRQVDLNLFRMLGQGAKGERVRFVQSVTGERIDGDFGAKTAASVIAYQQRKGLVADGIVGLNTFCQMVWEH